MDYRIVDDAVSYFNSRGLRNKYDHVRELIVVNRRDCGHRDCGAVKIVFGPELIAVRAEETKLHRNLLHQLSGEVARKFPTLRTQMLLMDIDGSVEDVSGSPDEDVADAAKAAPTEAASSSGH
jgi:hypothetical protein